MRWNPIIRPFYKRLHAVGEALKVALLTCGLSKLQRVKLFFQYPARQENPTQVISKTLGVYLRPWLQFLLSTTKNRSGAS
jgi:hypothetical protein